MYVTQQGNNSFITDAGRQSLLLQQSAVLAQQQAQGWAPPAGSSAAVMFTSAGFAPQGQSIVYQQQPQQVRMVQPQLQQQNVIMTGPQQVLVPRASPAVESQKQVVYVNVNGTLQRGVLQNGSVYLLANDGVGPQMAGNNQLCQVSAVQQTIGSQALSFQPQQPVMIQQVLPNGQLVPVSGALVAPRAGVQMPVMQQQPQMQVQMQARPMQAVAVSMGMNLQMQQQAGMQMAPRGAPNMTAPGRVMQASVGPQQQVLLQVPQGSVMQAAGGAMMRPAIATPGQANMSVNSVSTNTASLMPRIVNGTVSGVQAVQRLAPVASQPMTIAAALAALPSNPAGSAAGAKPELSSPVAPPGTPGMGGEAAAAAAAGTDAGTNGSMISKLSAPAPGRTTVISAPPAVSQAGPALTGSSPLTSQPGTPSRSNSVGANSSSSSSSSCNSAGSHATQYDTDHEGKLGVMRMFARTFIETGIGLEQALGMIQPADREMLVAAFAAEAAAAASGKAQPAAGAAASSAAAADSTKAAEPGGLSALGGEQVSMPPVKGGAPGPAGLLMLSNATEGSAVDGVQGAGQDNFSLGSWGFSLFSSVTSDLGSNQGGSSFGGVGDKVTAASTAATATATDSATATLFANLHV